MVMKHLNFRMAAFAACLVALVWGFRAMIFNHAPGAFSAPEETETVLMSAPSAKPTSAEMAHFIDCIETGKTPETTPEDSLKGLKVIWELYAAEEEHRLADLRGLGL